MLLTLGGCGALGSQIAVMTAHPKHTYYFIDNDKVGEENLFTSTYRMQDVNRPKAFALAMILFDLYRIKAEPFKTTFNQHNAPRFAETDLFIDTFDNVEARSIACSLSCPVLHVGVTEGLGIVVWDDQYSSQELSADLDSEKPCTHVLGRPLIRTTSTLAAYSIDHFTEHNVKINYVVKLDNGKVSVM